jgi:5-(carboxyamino)imidazole ribonucleotide mutase
MTTNKQDVAIIMGSSSDLPTMEKAIDVLKDFGISYKVKVVSAHRTPEFMQEFALSAKDNGFKVIIAGAGGAAHLPGMVASLTTLPVIGVPVALKHLSGLDSVLSILQMPRGVPVATVAIDNATNAALLAVRMLGIADHKIADQLAEFKKKQIQKVDLMNADLKV